MKEKRYFYENEMQVGSNVELSQDEFHHLANVMRSNSGEKVCLFNGDGNFYFGEIAKLEKKSCTIKINNIEKSENEPKIEFHLYQALAKGDKLSLIMQKITELGASKLCLFESKFCDAKPNENKPERLKQVSISASKQCGRATIVETYNKIYKISEICGIIKDYDVFYVAYENKTGETLADSLCKIKGKKTKKVAVMIGSEGGFSADEIEMLEMAGAKIVSLGSRILRTETASISCTALVMGLLENNK